MNTGIYECKTHVLVCTTRVVENFEGWIVYGRILCERRLGTYLMWRSNGNPRHGITVALMRKNSVKDSSLFSYVVGEINLKLIHRPPLLQ